MTNKTVGIGALLVIVGIVIGIAIGIAIGNSNIIRTSVQQPSTALTASYQRVDGTAVKVDVPMSVNVALVDADSTSELAGVVRNKVEHDAVKSVEVDRPEDAKASVFSRVGRVDWVNARGHLEARSLNMLPRERPLPVERQFVKFNVLTVNSAVDSEVARTLTVPENVYNNPTLKKRLNHLTVVNAAKPVDMGVLAGHSRQLNPASQLKTHYQVDNVRVELRVETSNREPSTLLGV